MLIRKLSLRPRVVLVCLLSCLGFDVLAQLSDDPSMLPLPDISRPDPARAVVITVRFNSHTEVVPVSVLVANNRARGANDDPPLILLEWLNHDGNIIGQQNAWHPLWTYSWDDEGVEKLVVEDSGTATFYVPLSETLSAIRITDIELGQELLTVNVATEVAAYCAATPNTPVCALYMNGFE